MAFAPITAAHPRKPCLPPRDAGAGKATIETTYGAIRTELVTGGTDLRVFWPVESKVGPHAVPILERFGRWHAKTRSWYVTLDRSEDLIAALAQL